MNMTLAVEAAGKLRVRDYRASSLRNLHFAVTSGLCGIYGGYNTRYMPAEYWPLRIAQHDDRDDELGKILLEADVFVGCEKQVKSGFLRRLQQFTIGQSIPTKVLCLPNRVAL